LLVFTKKRKNNRDRMKIIRQMLSVNENKRRIGLTKGDIMMVVVRRK